MEEVTKFRVTGRRRRRTRVTRKEGSWKEELEVHDTPNEGRKKKRNCKPHAARAREVRALPLSLRVFSSQHSCF